MAKNKSNEILTNKTLDKTADIVNVIAQTDPTAITTDEEVVAVVKGKVDGKSTDVLVIMRYRNAGESRRFFVFCHPESGEAGEGSVFS